MSASPLVIVPKYAKVGTGFSRREQAQALEHPGRRPDGVQTAATWVTELTDRRKVLILCSFCAPKFNPRRHGYRRFYNPDLTGLTPGHMVNGICDGCRQQTAHVGGGGTGYISEETYRLVCTDPLDARRRARAAAGATSAWGRIREFWSKRRTPEPEPIKTVVAMRPVRPPRVRPIQDYGAIPESGLSAEAESVLAGKRPEDWRVDD